MTHTATAPAPGDAPGRELSIPETGLVLLVGISGSGKSTFAARHFAASQVISSDYCRAVVSDDETDQSASTDAFALLHYIVDVRLRRGLLTVVDATNVQRKAREQLVRIAKDNDLLCSAIVLDVTETVARHRNKGRADRAFGDHVLARQRRDLRGSVKRLGKEGIRKVHVLSGPEEIDSATITLEKAWNDRRALTGPFDIVGDVHGCRTELEELLAELGYVLERDDLDRAVGARHPEGRTAVFVGDLVDRGPDTPGVLRLVMGMVESGDALCVSGNHEQKLARVLKERKAEARAAERAQPPGAASAEPAGGPSGPAAQRARAASGRPTRIAHGLAESLDQLAAQDLDFQQRAAAFCDGLVSHYVLDGGDLVVAHAGLKEAYHGRSSGRVRSFALYGDTTGERDEYGLPVRLPWADDYRGRAAVVYGHVPTAKSRWINNTICLDTGCVFGGRLTALRYPERELVDVAAKHTWYESTKPFLHPDDAAPATGAVRDPGMLDIADVLSVSSDAAMQLGGVIETAHGTVRVPGENAMAALEVLSRFSVDPRWLLYLPATMAPVATSADPAVLERPAEALSYFRGEGIDRVICQEKHMGSRAVAVVCRDEAAAARRFVPGTLGTVYTRTGRPFFRDPEVEAAVLAELRGAIDSAGLWDELGTDWLAFDGELLPWSAKAATLIRDQYASVAAAGRAALPAAGAALAAAAQRGLDVGALAERIERRGAGIEAFSAVYRRYTWDTDGAAGLRFAPFMVLAGEESEFTGRDHLWHMSMAERLAASTPMVLATRYLVVDTTDLAETDAATAWWHGLVAGGGEGMVVKPLAGALTKGRKNLSQPGLKVRGPEYLRIIYGPDYLDPDRLEPLRNRRLGRKSGLALTEHKLGVESLCRHARGEPLWRVHEPVFAVLAMESEPVDPRL